jgi:hypothetical protein
MESADDVRATLAVAALGDLRRHEATSSDGEARVLDLLAEAHVLSWPLVVDAASGLILDGSHRAVVLARDFGARFAVVQQVALDSPEVRIGTWCLVLEGVERSAFDRARRALRLEPGEHDGLRCHYGGRVYAAPESGSPEVTRVVSELPRLLAAHGRRPRTRFVEDEAVGTWLRSSDTVVVQLPALDKATVRRRADDVLLPPKSTRFRLPFRVLGLAVPLAVLGGSREALAVALERDRARPLACLGAGLTVDRRYPERLWQFADHRIPHRLFADEAGRRTYAEALAHATLPRRSGSADAVAAPGVAHVADGTQVRDAGTVAEVAKVEGGPRGTD